MLAGQRVLAIVTARGGSKGVPRKNLRLAGGKPLIAWTIEAALIARHVDRVILSSDDEEIIAVARAAGCEVPFVRETALGTDEATSAAVVTDALARVPGYGLFVLLQPTSPLRTGADIDAALELLAESGADHCVSVSEAPSHPFLTFRRNDDGYIEPFAPPPPGASLRRQDLPEAWTLNGAVFASHSAKFLEQGGFIGKGTVAYPMPRARSLDIDTAEDFIHLEAILKSRAGFTS